MAKLTPEERADKDEVLRLERLIQKNAKRRTTNNRQRSKRKLTSSKEHR